MKNNQVTMSLQRWVVCVCGALCGCALSIGACAGYKVKEIQDKRIMDKAVISIEQAELILNTQQDLNKSEDNDTVVYGRYDDDGKFVICLGNEDDDFVVEMVAGR